MQIVRILSREECIMHKTAKFGIIMSIEEGGPCHYAQT